MEQEHPNKLTIPLAIVVAGALIAGAIYFGGSRPSINRPAAVDPQDIEVPGVRDEDHYLGSRDAKVVIIEYSDTECPFCKVFHNTLKQVMNDYGTDVAWVYRHFPIPQLHAKAIKEAEATECAAELGGNQAFWNYLDEIFERTNSNDSLPESELPKIAGSVGLDVTAFNACLSSGRHNKKVTEQMEEAIEIGARGTPYSVLIAADGTQAVVNGAEPLANVKAKIDSLLK
jgi:protein-disulfide isomerase